MGQHHSKKAPEDTQNSVDKEVEEAKKLQLEQRKRIRERDTLLQSLNIKPVTLNIPKVKPDGSIRIVVISDTHCKASEIEEIPAGDVLIHCGDFTDFSTDEEVTEFCKFLEQCPHEYKLVIGGNHDESILAASTKQEKNPSKAVEDFLSEKYCTYLQNKTVEINSVKIYGVPWVKGDFRVTKSVYDSIPEGTDIVLTHAPPLGCGDCMVGTTHSGDQELLKTMLKIKPRYHLFGHAHEGYGIYQSQCTTFINAATCTRDLKPEHPPIVFDISS